MEKKSRRLENKSAVLRSGRECRELRSGICQIFSPWWGYRKRSVGTRTSGWRLSLRFSSAMGARLAEGSPALPALPVEEPARWILGVGGSSPVPAWLGSFWKRSQSTKAPCGQSGFGTSLGGHGTSVFTPPAELPLCGALREISETRQGPPGRGLTAFHSDGPPGRLLRGGA